MSGGGAGAGDARRLFVGIPVSLRTADDLAGATESLARRASGAGLRPRWVAPATYHVTLKYLGWCRAELVPVIVEGLERAAAGRRAFSFRTARLGAFPDPRKATVVWAGVEDAGGHLATLATRIDEEMVGLGFARERRPYKPHVTLGRLREPSAVAEVLLPLSEQVFSETRASELILFESVLKSDGSEYPTVARIALGRPENAPKRQTSPVKPVAPDASESASSPPPPADPSVDSGWE
ncbi:MAG: RNA 2',3'-cyclic phosphodiesterase [Kofleriaceae bacterium]|nr:RNA 2',3'-cyclic phosphodiesterase [Kofleriaceae bacterium]